MSEQWFENELSKQAKAKRLIAALLLFFLVVVIMSSCATQKRCFDKYGKVEPITIRDTIYVPKEVIKFSFKTLYDTLQVVDTFIINKERVRAIFTRDTILIECKADTVYREIKIKDPCIDKPDKKYWQFKEFWISIGALVFLLIVLYLSRR
jgi:hypothetical protein